MAGGAGGGTGGGTGGAGYTGQNGGAGTNAGGGGGGGAGYTPNTFPNFGKGGKGGGTGGGAGGANGYYSFNGQNGGNATAGSNSGGGGGGAGSPGISNPSAVAFGTGGTGGNGGNGDGSGGGGGGGAGGYGGVARLGTSSTNFYIGRPSSKSYTGGTGGRGGYGSPASLDGSGGDGGAGFVAIAQGGNVGITVKSGYSATGGAGGKGGAGGNGGAGVYFSDTIAAGTTATSSISINNSGTISGGAGGTYLYSAQNGFGGAGIAFAVTNNSIASNTEVLTNSGTIKGGSGISSGGVGVSGANLTVMNTGAGLIAGGQGAAALNFISGANTLSESNTATIQGKINVGSGSLTITEPQYASGASLTFSNIITGPGSLFYSNINIELTGTNTYYGGTTIGSGAAVTADSARSLGALASYITFAGSPAGSATLVLASNAQNVNAPFQDTLQNFGSYDALDLAGLTYTGGKPSFTIGSTPGSGTLTVKENGTTEYFNFRSNVAPNTTFYAHDDGNGGTRIDVVCFCTGTLIRTIRGEVAVEDLAVGDLAVTASGEHRPIRWVGHRDLDGAGRSLPFEQWPVRVLAGAFGPGLPSRTLYLSPGHPVLVEADEDGTGGHLVPVMCLINGTTIEREPRDSVTYWHVELDRHDILLAEGLPAESYLDWGDRQWFGADAEAHALLNPDFVVPGLGTRCRPVAVDGPVVDAERCRLDTVFAFRLASHCAWPSTGDLALKF